MSCSYFFQVMAHEVGHMFNLRHCPYFSCLMNGSNHLEEAEKKPLHLCPICLRKIHENINFDLRSRYYSLVECVGKLGGYFQGQQEWYRKAANHAPTGFEDFKANEKGGGVRSLQKRSTMRVSNVSSSIPINTQAGSIKNSVVQPKKAISKTGTSIDAPSFGSAKSSIRMMISNDYANLA